ncbi:hypothetical protein BROUX41_002289 [Berkeleyomyces rouxiae]|uniref:uncharacterized protein n=1 Tax=Berkeleyomyces rouxiae TaxID=2035830 RepID=UPI003B823BB6
MRSPLLLRAVAASLALGTASAQLSSLPACPQTCVSNMLAQATTFGCTSAADTACICAAPAFSSGAIDCTTKSCAAAELAQLNTYISTMCPAAGSSSSSSADPGAASSSSSASSATPVVSSTTSPAAAPGVSTPAAANPAVTSSVAGVVVPTNAVQSSSIIGIGTNSTMVTSVIASSTSSSASSSTFGAGMTPTTTSTSDNDSGDSKKSSGLSNAAKAGIGIGVGAVALAMIVIAGTFFLKKSKQQAEYSDKFSASPMAGTGSQFGYSSTHQRLPDTPGELKATRYEDMIPRAAPSN